MNIAFARELKKGFFTEILFDHGQMTGGRACGKLIVRECFACGGVAGTDTARCLCASSHRLRQNYVDFPKKNGYRSVHTTVLHSTGLKMEFQVRSGRNSLAVARRRNPSSSDARDA